MTWKIWKNTRNVFRRNGTYGLVEIKLGGGDLIEKGASTLKEFAYLIRPDDLRLRSFANAHYRWI